MEICPSMNGCIKNVIHTKRGILFSHKEKNGILSHTTTWIELEITILSVINQAQKDKYYVLSLQCGG